jgi:hypothetical protein
MATAAAASLLPASVVLAALAVASLAADAGTRRVRVMLLASVVSWVALFAVAFLAYWRRRSRARPPQLGRLWILAVLFWGLPALVSARHAISHGAAGAGDGPSIVLVTFDAMRADRLSLYGGRVPTPNFEALARESVAFDQARSQAPRTVASMTSMFSSLYPGELPHGRQARGHHVIR